MRVVIVWWELSESTQTIESLRTYLLGFTERPRRVRYVRDPVFA